MGRGRPDGDPSRSDDLDAVFAESDRPSRTPSERRARRPSWGRPVRGWRSTDEAEDDDLEGGPQSSDARARKVYWRARDSLWFEPLVAIAIIVVLLVGLFAFTSNWPPVYVVESNSMQHGSGDHVGFLNAGDVVLAQKIPQGQIATYFPSVANGGSATYGEPGDVLLYEPFGSASATPVVHRAILFLQFDKPKNAYNATSLAGLPCSSGSHPYYSTSTASTCDTVDLTGTLVLYHIGWKDVNVSIAFSSPTCVGTLGGHSGFLTMGDNNSGPDQVPGAGCSGKSISTLVEPGWVIGVARGLLPWFGALKLFLDGNSQLVPGASWEYLGLSVAGLVVAAAGVHLLLKRLGVRSDVRRREERRGARDALRTDETGDEDERPAPVRSWRAPDVDGDAEPPPAPKLSYEDRRRTHVASRARPRRPHGPPRPVERDGDDDDADL